MYSSPNLYCLFFNFCTNRNSGLPNLTKKIRAKNKLLFLKFIKSSRDCLNLDHCSDKGMYWYVHYYGNFSAYVHDLLRFNLSAGLKFIVCKYFGGLRYIFRKQRRKKGNFSSKICTNQEIYKGPTIFSTKVSQRSPGQNCCTRRLHLRVTLQGKKAVMALA